MCCPQSPTPFLQACFRLGSLSGGGEWNQRAKLSLSPTHLFPHSLHQIPPSGCVQGEMEIERKSSLLSSACSCNFLAFSLLVLPNSVSTIPQKTTVGVYLLTEMLRILPFSQFLTPLLRPLLGILSCFLSTNCVPTPLLKYTPQPSPRFKIHCRH